ncbi:Hypothetical predicted protein, partial [Paramuricea clavata]
ARLEKLNKISTANKKRDFENQVERVQAVARVIKGEGLILDPKNKYVRELIKRSSVRTLKDGTEVLVFRSEQGIDKSGTQIMKRGKTKNLVYSKDSPALREYKDLLKKIKEPQFDDSDEEYADRENIELIDISAKLGDLPGLTMQENNELRGVLNPPDGSSIEGRTGPNGALQVQADYFNEAIGETVERATSAEGTTEYNSLIERIDSLKEARDRTLEQRTVEEAREAQLEDISRLRRFIDWVGKEKVGLVGIAVSTASLITALLIHARGAIVKTAKATGKVAKTLANLAKKAGPILVPILNAVATALSWGAKGITWLASHLWVVVVAGEDEEREDYRIPQTEDRNDSDYDTVTDRDMINIMFGQTSDESMEGDRWATFASILNGLPADRSETLNETVDEYMNWLDDSDSDLDSDETFDISEDDRFNIISYIENRFGTSIGDIDGDEGYPRWVYEFIINERGYSSPPRVPAYIAAINEEEKYHRLNLEILKLIDSDPSQHQKAFDRVIEIIRELPKGNRTLDYSLDRFLGDGMEDWDVQGGSRELNVIDNYINDRFGIRTRYIKVGKIYPKWVNEIAGDSREYFRLRDEAMVGERDTVPDFGEEQDYYERWRATIISSIGLRRYREALKKRGVTEKEFIDLVAKKSRKLLMVKKIYDDHMNEIRRLRDWAKENKSPLGAAIASVTVAVILVEVLSRVALSSGSSYTARAANKVRPDNKGSPSIADVVRSAVAKALDAVSDLTLWLAGNLWAAGLGIAVVVYAVNS